MALSEQEIHVMVKVLPSNFEFICTAVYASPRFHKRCVLWNNFKNAASLHDKPWVIVGDFNEVLLEGDKYGGRSISSSRSLVFKECLDYCSMVDMGFVGPRFTWTNKRNFSALVEERINRFFANPSWYALHPDTSLDVCQIIARYFLIPILPIGRFSLGLLNSKIFGYRIYLFQDLLGRLAVG